MSSRPLLACLLIAALAQAVTAGSASAEPPTCYPPSRDTVVSVGSSVAVSVSCYDGLGGSPGIALVPDPAIPATVTVGPGTDLGDITVTISAGASAAPGAYVLTFSITGAAEPGSFTLPFSIRVPPPPTCEDTTYPFITPRGEPVEIYHGCGTQPDGLAAVVEVTANPAHGTVTIPDIYNLRYTPAANFTGTDRFSFRARDGVTTGPEMEVTVQVTNASEAVVSFAYAKRYCVNIPAQASCNPGYGRRTPGGGEKVSHRSWPRVNGIFFWFPAGGGGRLTGGPHSDELLGHHGSDTVRGGAGRDVLWGDWDPKGNNTTQVDVLDGGAGRDVIYTSHGHNTVRGGKGNDLIWAFYGTGTVDCGPGIDKVRIRAGAGNYKLRGCEKFGTF